MWRLLIQMLWTAELTEQLCHKPHTFPFRQAVRTELPSCLSRQLSRKATGHRQGRRHFHQSGFWLHHLHRPGLIPYRQIWDRFQLNTKKSNAQDKNAWSVTSIIPLQFNDFCLLASSSRFSICW
jgi:hypothetical protein